MSTLTLDEKIARAEAKYARALRHPRLKGVDEAAAELRRLLVEKHTVQRQPAETTR